MTPVVLTIQYTMGDMPVQADVLIDDTRKVRVVLRAEDVEVDKIGGMAMVVLPVQLVEALAALGVDVPEVL